jgi:tetratricopeptide (TPR) repeat protein
LYALIIAVGFNTFQEKDDKVVNQKQKSMPWVSFALIQSVFILMVYLASVVPFYTSMLVIDSNLAFANGDVVNMMRLIEKIKTKQTPYLDEQAFLYSRNLISIANSGNLEKWPDWRKFYNEAIFSTEKILLSHPKDAHGLFVYASMLATVGIRAQDAEIIAKAEENYKKAIVLSPKRQQLFFGLAELQKATGRTDEAMETYLTAANFDPEIGEGWWYIGLTYYFNKQQPATAAEYLRRSMTVKYPQGYRNAEDAIIVAQAFVTLNDKENMQKLVKQLPYLPAAQSQEYIQIAKFAEELNLLEERNLILHAVAGADPATMKALAPLFSGEVDTIEESLMITKAMAETAPPENVGGEDANRGSSGTEISTTSSGYSGPRR